jgi:NADH:ubiquinone oxidoreductase subunit 4 (subunit M)
LWVSLDGDGQFQGLRPLKWVSWLEPGFQYLIIGVDGVSIFFIILTALLISICILISLNTVTFLIKEFLLCLLFIEILLFGVFLVLELVGFYILFEAILVPMFLIIGIWGSREEKIQASYYFFFYTFIGSVFMLLGIFLFYSYVGSTDYQTLCYFKIETKLQYFLFLGFFFSLAIKIPKIPFHI